MTSISAKANKGLFPAYILLLIVLISCSSQKNATSKEPMTEKEQIEKILGTKYDCVSNDTKQYKLCFIYEYEQKVKYVSFVVYEIDSNQIIHHQLKARRVKWDSKHLLRVDDFIRMPTGEGTDDYYLYDVKKKEKLN